jgi:nicotinate dehydrogenase subunit A
MKNERLSHGADNGLDQRDFPTYFNGDMSAITLKVNGKTHTLDLDPGTPLLYALSDDLELRGPKFGCGLGQCGACTVIVKGQAQRSCIMPVASVNGEEITTLEGLGTVEKPHRIQQAFIEEQAAQCGFCLNAIIMTAKAFLDKNPKATDEQIQQAMSGVLCRCFTHVRMLRAIKRYAKGVAR